MRSFLFKTGVGTLVFLGLGAMSRRDDYTIDAAHSSVSFKIKHFGLSYVHGRFNSFSGGFTDRFGRPCQDLVQPDDQVDRAWIRTTKGATTTSRSPDFFNAKQYRLDHFKSSAVKPVEGGYEVTGDLTLHGETKPITFTLSGGQVINDPRAGPRTGFSADFVINRTDFGVGKNMKMLGEDVHVSVGFEGTKKR